MGADLIGSYSFDDYFMGIISNLNVKGKVLFVCLIFNIFFAFYFAYLGDAMSFISVISGIFCHIGIRSKKCQIN